MAEDTIPLPMPAVDVPDATLLRLAPGNLVLLSTGSGTKFCVVNEEVRVVGFLAANVAELSFDGISQAVLPWRPVEEGWQATFQRGLDELRDACDAAGRLTDRREDESVRRTAKARLQQPRELRVTKGQMARSGRRQQRASRSFAAV